MYWNSFTYFKNTVRNCVEKYFFDNPLTDQTVGKSTFIEGGNSVSDEIKKLKILDWYSHYGDSIFNFIAMMTKDYHKAEDLTQETFLKAFIYLDGFKANSSAKTWLFSIARNVTIDYLRKQKRRNILLHILPHSEKKELLTEQIVEINEEFQELYRAIHRLKESYREVIILRQIKEFSIVETSEILGWSESKVKNTLSRALRVLEKELIKEGFTYEKLS